MLGHPPPGREDGEVCDRYSSFSRLAREDREDGRVLDRGRRYKMDGSWTEGDGIRWTGPGQRVAV